MEIFDFEGRSVAAMKAALLAIAALSIAACGQKNEEDQSGMTTGKTVAGSLEYTALGDFMVEAEIPAGTLDSRRRNKVGTITIGTSPKILVQSEEDFERPKDLDATKKEIQEAEGFQEFVKEEVGEDGSFRLEYTKKSGKGPSYGFKIRKKLGDKFFDCGTKSWDEDQTAKDELSSAMKTCDSLRLAQ